jgi:hypothetical protein
MLDTARQFMSNLPSMSGDTERAKRPELRVGFVGPIMRKLISTWVHELPADTQAIHNVPMLIYMHMQCWVLSTRLYPVQGCGGGM